MAKQSINRAAKAVTYIIILLLLIGLIGGIAYLTRGCTENIKTFSLKIGDNYILRDESNIALKSGTKITVNSSEDYSVSVYAYADYNDFEFKYSGNTVSWSDFKDVDFLTLSDSSLKIDKQSDGFTLTYNLFADIISMEKNIEISDEMLSSQFDRFRLVVTSNGSEISVCFRLSYDIGKVVLSPDSIIL